MEDSFDKIVLKKVVRSECCLLYLIILSYTEFEVTNEDFEDEV